MTKRPPNRRGGGDFRLEVADSRTHPHLAHSLEDEILTGAVRVEPNEAGYPAFTYRPNDREDDLRLIRTSSSSSSAKAKKRCGWRRWR